MKDTKNIDTYFSQYHNYHEEKRLKQAIVCWNYRYYIVYNTTLYLTKQYDTLKEAMDDYAIFI